MKIFGSILLTLFLTAVSPGQDDERERSRVQWVNASCAAPVEFTLNRATLSRAWAPGQRNGLGEFPLVNWQAEFTPPQPQQPISVQLELRNGDSAAAVLIGDFAPVDERRFAGAKLPPGYSEGGDRRPVRAGLVKVPIPKSKGANYPVYLLNGIPGRKVRVEVEPQQVFELEYGVLKSFTAPPGTRTLVKLEGETEPVGFDVDNLSRGGLFAFYCPPGKESVEYTFVRLHSIESYLERTAARTRSDESRAD